MAAKIIDKIKSIKHLKCIIVFLLSFVLGCFILSCLYLSKMPIKDAKISDLIEINGIGEIKAEQIEKYYDCNPDADINDAEQIKGIGKETVDKLKKEYR